MSQRIMIIVAFCCLTVMGAAAQDGKSVKKQSTEIVRIGFAKAPISGCGNLGSWTIHDELYGGALYIDDGKSPVVLLTLDYVEMAGKQTAEIKKVITQKTGIPADHIMICCSHTHSGMETDNNTKLGEVLSDVILKAREKAEPAKVAFERFKVGKGFVVNRRVVPNEHLGAFTMNYSRGTKASVENGTVDARGQVEDFIRYGVNIYSPNYSSRGIPAGRKQSSKAQAVLDKIPKELYLNGPVDPYLEVLAFRRSDGTSIGTVVRYTCHPIIFSGSTFKQFSADYPGVLTREISKMTGTPTLFINGPCGNIKPVFTYFGEAETERFGGALAQIVTKSMSGLKSEPLLTFRFIHRDEDFEVAPDMLIRKPAAFAGYDSLLNTDFDPVLLKKKLDLMMRGWAVGYYKLKDEKMHLPFSLLGFNGIALITMPGEIFNEHGMAVKNRYSAKPVMIGELADTDEPGYVPTREAFKEGGYEVSCATIVPGSGEKMVQIAIDMLKDFYKRR